MKVYVMRRAISVNAEHRAEFLERALTYAAIHELWPWWKRWWRRADVARTKAEVQRLMKAVITE